MKLLVGSALPAALLALSASAQTLNGAHTLSGDWHGELKLPLTLRVGLHVIEAANGALKAATTTEAGVGESPDWTGAQTGDAAKLSTPANNGQRIEVKWDAAQGAWVGQFFNTSGVFPITLVPGPMPPPPKVDGLDGEWAGKVVFGDLSMRVVLHVKTQGASTTATLDSPDQAAYAIRVSSLARNRDAVSFEIPTISLSYTATLSADGKTIHGAASALGVIAPLTLTRQ